MDNSTSNMSTICSGKQPLKSRAFSLGRFPRTIPGTGDPEVNFASIHDLRVWTAAYRCEAMLDSLSSIPVDHHVYFPTCKTSCQAAPILMGMEGMAEMKCLLMVREPRHASPRKPKLVANICFLNEIYPTGLSTCTYGNSKLWRYFYPDLTEQNPKLKWLTWIFTSHMQPWEGVSKAQHILDFSCCLGFPPKQN